MTSACLSKPAARPAWAHVQSRACACSTQQQLPGHAEGAVEVAACFQHTVLIQLRASHSEPHVVQWHAAFGLCSASALPAYIYVLCNDAAWCKHSSCQHAAGREDALSICMQLGAWTAAWLTSCMARTNWVWELLVPQLRAQHRWVRTRLAWKQTHLG